jgi:hypothetical protein
MVIEASPTKQADVKGKERDCAVMLFIYVTLIQYRKQRD